MTSSAAPLGNEEDDWLIMSYLYDQFNRPVLLLMVMIVGVRNMLC